MKALNDLFGKKKKIKKYLLSGWMKNKSDDTLKGLTLFVDDLIGCGFELDSIKCIWSLGLVASASSTLAEIKSKLEKGEVPEIISTDRFNINEDYLIVDAVHLNDKIYLFATYSPADYIGKQPPGIKWHSETGLEHKQLKNESLIWSRSSPTF